MSPTAFAILSAYRVGEPAARLRHRRRRPRHRAGRISRRRQRRYSRHPGAVVRAAGERIFAPKSYPALAVACASTHDLPTLAGWWIGADIAERKALGLLSVEEERRAMERAEKSALVAALVAAGLIAAAPTPSAARRCAGPALYAFVAARRRSSHSRRSTILSARQSRRTFPAPTASVPIGVIG